MFTFHPLRSITTGFLALLLATSTHAQTNPNRDKLDAHTAEFEKGVIEVLDGVHVAIGFGLANSILIEGDDGLIIVDTMESMVAANEVKAAFDKISDKPVKAIIYTHNHTDHVMGAAAFAGDDNPEVYAHDLTAELVDKIYTQITPAIRARSVRQFGVTLPPNKLLNDGIGPKLRVSLGGNAGYIKPTKTFTDTLETTVAGVKIKLVHAVGETDDQLYVWLPDKKVLLPGDNFYKAFPNLYAIRGTSYRDVRQWANSLDLMIAEAPEYLIPSHTRPLVGADTIRETLSNYRDAIRYVHDETIKGLNAGKTSDELAQTITLPQHLADQPYLQEFYGTVAWSVRSVFTGYLGWFDGNATTLFPLSAQERAKRIAQLFGPTNGLQLAADKALQEKDYQWAAELADALLALDPKNKSALTLKADALEALGEQQISANGRNYYLTQAAQLRAQAR